MRSPSGCSMAADYTDGGGWAKLDATAVDELAAIIGGFSPRYLEKQARMLLTLYQSMSADGTISMGYRTLAERADVSKSAAQRFVKKLEDTGDLVVVGERVNDGGRYTVRRFAWMGGDPLNRVTPDPRKPEKRVTPDPRKPEKRVTSELLRSSQKGGVSANAAPPPENRSETTPPLPGMRLVI